MASKTQIGNRALSKLGQPGVANIDTTDTKPARVIRNMWDSVLDAMLQAYPWKFAGIRAQLAADSDSPLYDWDNQFTVPTDYLAIRSIKDKPPYEIEGASDGTLKIVTDADAPLYLKYTRRITNTGQFHPLFAEVLASELAYQGCEEITQSNTKKADCLKDKIIAIQQAFAIDAIEDPEEELPEDEWIEDRA